MSIEKIDEKLTALQNKREKMLRETDKQIAKLMKERSDEVALKAGRIFAKHKITPMELKQLQKVSKEELKKIFAIVGKKEQTGKASKETQSDEAGGTKQDKDEAEDSEETAETAETGKTEDADETGEREEVYGTGEADEGSDLEALNETDGYKHAWGLRDNS